MPAIIEGPPTPGAAQRPLWRRLLWFAGLAFAGAASAVSAAYALRALLPSP